MNPRAWLMRLCALFQKERLEADLNQDIREHLQMATEENIRAGMNPREAAEAARRSFGGVEQMKEEFRDQRGFPAIETLGRETRFALRSLGRSPAFTALAILTLALAIGANSAIFSAVSALLFSPPGILEPSRVVVFRARYDKLNLRDLVVSFDNFKAVSASTEIFSSAAIAKTGSFAYTGGSYPRQLAALRVSSKWFDVFGVQPARGRLFTPEEDQPNNNRVALLTDAAWRDVFGADASIVGKTIDLDRLPYRVIGILKRDYSPGINELGGLTGHAADVLIPLGLPAANPQMPYLETFLGVARLQPAIPLSKARAFMSILTDRGYQDPRVGRPREDNGWGLYLVPYSDFASGEMKTPLLILWGAVAFVLLIACANIAGLMLARTTARSREFAVRSALGGTRWHLLRQTLAESFLLAASGSIAGLGVAFAFLRGVQVFGPERVVGGMSIPFNVSILLFTASAGVFAGALFGMAPASQLGRVNTNEALKEGGRSSTEGRERFRLRSILVTAEVALALVLSIGAGLLLRSLQRLQDVDLGFDPQAVTTASLTLPEARYNDPERVLAFFRTALDRLKSLPGVTSAAAAYGYPFGIGSEGRTFQIVGRPARPNEPALEGEARLVTPGFFSTLRIPLKRGRVFSDLDGRSAEPVTVIDERLARQYWPDQDPIGQQIILQGGIAARIVGIVGHTKQSDIASDAERGTFYFPFFQTPIAFGTFLVRSAGNVAGVARSMREAVQSIDPAQPVYDVKTMQELVSATLAARRFTIALLGMFAVAAVFLAALGLYGVINYGVTQRTQEIGIRMALGAQRAQVLALVVGDGMRLTLVGLVLGWMAAFALARMLPNQLFGVSAFDPVTFAAMAVLLAVVALFASAIPAQRAMHLDPLVACRYE